jgi:Asp-tRNA(Asn)/Glu-tRNA(Gln) amidotransferase A subunit family amidase
MCLHIITDNNIWGLAKNPYDHRRTTGGSSGGSGGMVSTRCAPISLTSDLAGSIRFPAAWCGVYSFQPTPQRVSKKWASSWSEAEDCSALRELYPSFGPMGEFFCLILRQKRG